MIFLFLSPRELCTLNCALRACPQGGFEQLKMPFIFGLVDQFTPAHRGVVVCMLLKIEPMPIVD